MDEGGEKGNEEGPLVSNESRFHLCAFLRQLGSLWPNEVLLLCLLMQCFTGAVENGLVKLAVMLYVF